MEIFISIREYVTYMSKYLDLTGLQLYDDKIKSYVDFKNDKLYDLLDKPLYQLEFTIEPDVSNNKFMINPLNITLYKIYSISSILIIETTELVNISKLVMEHKAYLYVKLIYNNYYYNFIPNISEFTFGEENEFIQLFKTNLILFWDNNIYTFNYFRSQNNNYDIISFEKVENVEPISIDKISNLVNPPR